ncbi:MAG: hypothetical protein QF886_04435, partial [Planctomycetota bacterium]|nr:hypothetical protein [Planctomycetota bacterium]
MRKALSGLMIAAWLTSLAIHAETPAKTAKKKLPDWNTVIAGAKQMPGLFSLFFKADEQKLLMEIKPDQ